MIVPITGEIVADDDQWIYDWFGISCVAPATIRNAIAALPEGETLELEINSVGGNVWAGFEMYSLLRGCRRPTKAMVTALAASAASTVMIGCDTVLLSPVAQVMIHMPACCTYGNQFDHEESIHFLDAITASILNGYELRCAGRTSREELLRRMEEATWLPAQDVIALGLADGLLYGEDAAALPLSVANAVGAGLRGAVDGVSILDTAALLRRYEDAVRAGAAAAPGHPVAGTAAAEGALTDGGEPAPAASAARGTLTDAAWALSARLALERARLP